MMPGSARREKPTPAGTVLERKGSAGREKHAPLRSALRSGQGAFATGGSGGILKDSRGRLSGIQQKVLPMS